MSLQDKQNAFFGGGGNTWTPMAQQANALRDDAQSDDATEQDDLQQVAPPPTPQQSAAEEEVKSMPSLVEQPPTAAHTTGAQVVMHETDDVLPGEDVPADFFTGAQATTVESHAAVQDPSTVAAAKEETVEDDSLSARLDQSGVDVVAAGFAAQAPAYQEEPQKAAAPVDTGSVTVEEAVVDENKKTILIIDDDLDTLILYENVFKAANYNVLRSEDGLQGLKTAQTYKPDVIFTGIKMPRLDGFGMMEGLQKDAALAAIPIVINSHLGRDADRKRAQELGAKDFIVRDYTPPREVVERIGALLLDREYILKIDGTARDAARLADDLGSKGFLACSDGEELVVRMSVQDAATKTFTARFDCVQKENE